MEAKPCSRWQDTDIDTNTQLPVTLHYSPVLSRIMQGDHDAELQEVDQLYRENKVSLSI